MSYCTVRGIRIYYEMEGQGDPVILLHGACQDTLSWRFNIKPLAEKFQVYAIDLPGHGKSALLPEGPVDNLEAYADFVIDFIDTLQIKNPIIVGHSMSGGIGMYIALKRPENTRLVVPVDGAAFTNGTYGAELFSNVAINTPDWMEINFRTICSKNTSPERVNEIAFDVQRCAPKVAYNDIYAYGNFSLRDRVADLQVPIFFIHGEDDWSITPEMARETQKMLKCRSEFRLLAGNGHFPHTENPDSFNKAFLELMELL
ncbi:MAG: alpha/beta fold hydrolase [Bacillota bacterium]|jgi:pimeloyl-ACP methyl ester carboxylesterase|nr:alpha/beta hydrolase [Clostridia bacterium]